MNDVESCGNGNTYVFGPDGDIDEINRLLEEDRWRPEALASEAKEARPSRDILGTSALMKESANDIVKQGEFGLATRIYREAIWLLMAGDSDFVPSAAIDAASMGRGSGTCHLVKDGVDVTQEADRLRINLHLNLAHCALKLQTWEVARIACNFVLSEEPDNTKALFRISQAFQGLGQWVQAARAAQRGLDLEPGNASLRQLYSHARTNANKEKEQRELAAEQELTEMCAALPPESFAKVQAMRQSGASRLEIQKTIEAFREEAKREEANHSFMAKAIEALTPEERLRADELQGAGKVGEFFSLLQAACSR